MNKLLTNIENINFSGDDNVILKHLKQYVKDGNSLSDSFNYAVREAAYHGKVKCFEFIIKQKNVDVTANRHTALHFSIENGHHKIASILLDNYYTPDSIPKDVGQSKYIEDYYKKKELTKKIGKFKDFLDL